MRCPICTMGAITVIILKRSGTKAFLCPYCHGMWSTIEDIHKYPGRLMRLFPDDDFEYTLSPNEEKDQEHRSSRYVGFR